MNQQTLFALNFRCILPKLLSNLTRLRSTVFKVFGKAKQLRDCGTFAHVLTKLNTMYFESARQLVIAHERNRGQARLTVSMDIAGHLRTFS